MDFATKSIICKSLRPSPWLRTPRYPLSQLAAGSSSAKKHVAPRHVHLSVIADTTTEAHVNAMSMSGFPMKHAKNQHSTTVQCHLGEQAPRTSTSNFLRHHLSGMRTEAITKSTGTLVPSMLAGRSAPTLTSQLTNRGQQDEEDGAPYPPRSE